MAAAESAALRPSWCEQLFSPGRPPSLILKRPRSSRCPVNINDARTVAMSNFAGIAVGSAPRAITAVSRPVGARPRRVSPDRNRSRARDRRDKTVPWGQPRRGCRLSAQTLQVAEYDRFPVSLRQSVDFFMEFRPGLRRSPVNSQLSLRRPPSYTRRRATSALCRNATRRDP